MEYKLESCGVLKTAENTLNNYAQKGWTLHTFTTSNDGKYFYMVFSK